MNRKSNPKRRCFLTKIESKCRGAGIIYSVGGGNGQGAVCTVEMYDPLTDTWSKAEDMPTPKSLAGIAVIHNSLFVVGGCNGKMGKPRKS